jgi:hypothetical protein
MCNGYVLTATPAVGASSLQIELHIHEEFRRSYPGGIPNGASLLKLNAVHPDVISYFQFFLENFPWIKVVLQYTKRRIIFTSEKKSS